MARRWSAAVATPAAAAGAAFATIAAPAGSRARITEIGFFNNAGTIGSVQLIRANNTYVATTTVSPVPDNPDDPVGTTLVSTAWSTAPTIQTVPLRRITLPPSSAAGVIWQFEDLVVGPVGAGQALVLWNFGTAAASVLQLYVSTDG